jgi:hypothetical protein
MGILVFYPGESDLEANANISTEYACKPATSNLSSLFGF